MNAYELDPIFEALPDDCPPGCIPVRDLLPPGFETSEHYRISMQQRGLVDGIVHITRLEAGGAVTVGTRSETRLSNQEIQRHEEAYPTIAACSQHVARLAQEEEQPHLASREVEIETALDRFGGDVLTPREQEVVRLVLRGHSGESVGNQLEISLHTVKRHRLAAYTKLKVSSQGELFQIFYNRSACAQT